MRKLTFFIINILLFSCNLMAQGEVTVLHSTTGSMASEIATALGAMDKSTVTKLTVAGDGILSLADCQAIASNFATSTLKTLDLAQAKFENDSIPRQTSGGAFSEMQMNAVILPSNLRVIGDRAFRYCKELTSINLPSTLKKIGEGAFVNNSKISISELPDGIETLGAYAFQNASALSLKKLPSALKGEIGTNAFSGTLVSFSELPAGIIAVKNNAFSKTAITEMTFPFGFIQIGNKAFDSCALKQLTFKNIAPPSFNTDAGNHSFLNVTLSNISVCVPDGYLQEYNVAPLNLMKEIKECGESGVIVPDYEIADWHGFRTSAVTYTFDDNTTKQFTVAQPLFDKYDYKTTFFVITNKITNWTNYINAANKGHEITSHTVNHKRLDNLSIEEQESELKNSQSVIKLNTKSNCATVAYPNCALADRATTTKYYIAGRACTGTIIPRTPADFYRISSISTGSASENYVQTPKQFNDKVNAAKNSKGWCVFLIHCIDDEKSYSPTQSDSIAKHLEYVNENDSHFWVATFENVVKYIKERDALAFTETVVSENSIKLTATDGLDDEVYNVPVTVRRILPDGWENAQLRLDGGVVDSKIAIVSGKKYIVFDIVPDSGELVLSKVENSSLIEAKDALYNVSPNPFKDVINISTEGQFEYNIYALNGRLLEKGRGFNSVEAGSTLLSGTYLLKIVCENKQIFEQKIIKL